MPNLTKLSRIVGLSPATVSRVLNNHPSQRISPQKRQLILDTAKKYNYRPNFASRALAMRKTMNVGVVLYHDATGRMANHHPTPSVMRALQKTLQELYYGLSMIFVSYRDPAGSFKKLIQTHRTFDALVFHSLVGTREMVEIAREERIPNAVIVDSRAVDWPTNYFHFDEDGDTAEAIRHVLSLGHRKIAVVGWDVAGRKAENTFTRSASDFLVSQGIDIPEEWVIALPEEKREDPFYLSRDHGRDAGRQLLSGQDRPTAIVAWGDMIALGIVDAMRERGLEAGRDIALTGYGNSEAAMASEQHAQLTTFDFPIPQLGDAAARALVRQIDDPELPLERLLVPSKLIARRSTLGMQKHSW